MFFKTASKFDFMIVGLGNPTPKYKGSRHNVGFDALDAIARVNKIEVKKAKFSALYGTGEISGVKVILLKPQTFMNLSGKAVGEAAKFYKIKPENVIVLLDDISLCPGAVRIRLKGSAGGHNGIKSIIDYIGYNFPRIKIGVGAKPHPEYDLADWVLAKPKPADAQLIEKRHDDICEAVSLLCAGNPTKAMNLYNS